MTTKQKIAELQRMTTKQLKERYEQLFEEPCRSNNRQHLVKRCAWRIQSLEEGDMTQRMTRIKERARELARDVDIRVRPPKDQLASPTKKVRNDGFTVTKPMKVKKDERLPMIGAKIKRKYKGHVYTVEVLPNGFEYDGEAYKSLSAVAHAITGNHWNGYLFFGLSKSKD